MGRTALTTVEEPLHRLAVGDLFVSGTAQAMLARLHAPTWFRIPGRDRGRCRAVTTLLHGNEPSGFRALHAYLASGEQPATDLLCLVGAVPAAQLDPPFSNRSLPDGRDLNRCFRAPFAGREGKLAKALLDVVEDVRPEALIDLHNTSGRGPAYAVTTTPHPAHSRLAAFFTQRVIVTDLRLGALTEATSAWFPSVVIECGGAGDPAADRAALEGLRHYAGADDALHRDPPPMEVFEHPVRVELAPNCSIAYADKPIAGVDVVLQSELDRHNFGVVAVGMPLGWVGGRGLASLRVRAAHEVRGAKELLAVRRDRLIAASAFRPLMITTQPAIAASDCLFYAVLERSAPY